MLKLTPELEAEWSFGKAGQRPIRIAASLNTRSLGDFAAHLFYVNTVAQQFDRSVVTILYRNDAAFKPLLLRLMRVDIAAAVPKTSLLPALDIFDPYASPHAVTSLPEFKDWFKANLNYQDLVITDAMTREFRAQAFEHLGYLNFPEDAVAECTSELVNRGLDPGKWFCTVHAREPMTGKHAEERNVDPETYRLAAVHILENLGGQVVRLGDPEMTPWPAMKGLVDLSKDDSSTWLQIFAVSRSRFLLASPSGPLSIADAMHVPSGLANAIQWSSVNDRSVLRSVDVIAPDGRILNQESLAQEAPGRFKRLTQAGYRVRQLPASEIIRLADYMFNRTTDTSGWRVPDPPWTGPKPNQLVFPGTLRPRANFLPS